MVITRCVTSDVHIRSGALIPLFWGGLGWLTLGANFHTPLFCFDGYGLTLNLSQNKTIAEIWTKTCISTPIPPFWQGNGTNPAPHSHP
jgi:hypothetical protein